MRGLVLAFIGIVVTGGIIAAVVAFFGLDFSTQASRADIHTAASVGMHALSMNQQVNERLGVPVQMGELKVQREEKPFLGTHTVTLSIAMTGPKATGKATVNLVKEPTKKVWVFKNGELFPSNGPPIFVR